MKNVEQYYYLMVFQFIVYCKGYKIYISVHRYRMDVYDGLAIYGELLHRYRPIGTLWLND